MPPADIRITAEPVDEGRCKFVVSETLYAGTRRYTSAAEAEESALASRIFAIPGAGVVEVTVSDNVVTVTKRSPAPWTATGRAVGGAIREALATGAPLVAARQAATDEAPDDDVLYERVAQLFERQVNPMVARHGGVVELVDVQDAVVMVRLGGGCQGCGMADVTLRQGIEGMLRRDIPEIQGLVDVTDHTAGSNPYFAAAKK
ncbi:MAG TPA: NifU family protein [Gemmatimonadales bacterium]|nr:NifU family protein [Gemmatimonadales bacterium]